MIALAIGAGELVWGALLKFAPVRLFQCIGMSEEAMTPEQRAKSVLKSGRNSSLNKKIGKDDKYVSA